MSFQGLCMIHAHGSPYMVSEFAEQIAWLATTLRLSPRQKTPVVLSPRVSISPEKSTEESHNNGITMICELTFDIAGEQFTSGEGTCWTQLFANPIMVGGYPVLRKSTPAAGLETSLNIMASLLQAYQIVRLENRIIMKGFNSLAVASAVGSAFVRWHVFTSGKPDKRISYFDPRVEESVSNKEESPLLRSLVDFRHIIGWCSEVTEFCGRL